MATQPQQPSEPRNIAKNQAKPPRQLTADSAFVPALAAARHTGYL